MAEVEEFECENCEDEIAVAVHDGLHLCADCLDEILEQEEDEEEELE